MNKTVVTIAVTGLLLLLTGAFTAFYVITTPVFPVKTSDNLPMHYLVRNSIGMNPQKFRNVIRLRSLNVNETSDNGVSALHVAVLFNNIGVIPVLISEGANVNARDEYGNTPLHYAAQLNSVNAVHQLLRNKAKTLLRNDDGLTPLEEARANNSSTSNEAAEIIKILRKGS